LIAHRMSSSDDTCSGGTKLSILTIESLRSGTAMSLRDKNAASSWTPDWMRISDGDQCVLVVTSTSTGLTVTLWTVPPAGSLSECCDWLRAWVESWLSKQSEEARWEADPTYLGVLFRPWAASPTGVVDGKGVDEVRYGSYPAGPPNGVPRSLEELCQPLRASRKHGQ
jgi:hypothetical protein